ncbi:MAG: type secretion system secreted protein Hcp [Acidobacteriota bacterium]|nr:type secretion system secreted protein Hcp [Acidobacteriota bacterium]MDT7807536.1 type secretion system secreted protein Hcp [Acidobacteriota bacterium]
MDVIILDMGADPKGESMLTGFKDKIELLSFSHGVAMQITGDISNSERTSGKPNHQDLTVTKYLDAASPVLCQSCCEGKAYPKVDIIIGRNDSGAVVELMRYTIKNALISSISIGGGGGDKPVETLTLNYNQITWNFTSQKPEVGSEGNVNGKWNLSTNKAE